MTITRKELMVIRDRILKSAGKNSKYLAEQDAFCSPATFWGLALSFNLCSKEEFDQARQFYGDMWNYVGD